MEWRANLKQIVANILSNTEVMKGHYLLRVQAMDIAVIARPGQFVMIRCGEKLTLRRPISIRRITGSGEIYFLYTGVSLLGETYRPDREVGQLCSLLPDWLIQSTVQLGPRVDCRDPDGLLEHVLDTLERFGLIPAGQTTP